MKPPTPASASDGAGDGASSNPSHRPPNEPSYNTSYRASSPSSIDDPDLDSDLPIRQWTKGEVQALKGGHPAVSLWRVVAMQALVGVLLAAASWWLGGHRSNVMWSALYGAACVVLPSALFAYGMSRQVSALNAGGAMFGFMLWEFVKIGVAVIMMVAAIKVVPQLSWPAFLVALVVCIKLNWLILLMQGRVKKNVASDNR